MRRIRIRIRTEQENPISMESRPRAFPLSLTDEEDNPSPPPPKVSLLFSSSSGIRALPTPDDSDFEFSISPNGKKHPTSTTTTSSCNYSSVDDNGFESESFVSGEDEFENALDRPFVTDIDPDDDSLEQTRYLKKNVISRPFDTDPDEEFVEESGQTDENGIFRPFVANPDEETLGKRGQIDENGVFRPFVVNPGEETLEVEDEGGSNVVELLKTGMPIAMLSGDTDDDSTSSLVFEDDGFSGSIRIAPKVKVLEDEEEDEFSSIEGVNEEIVDEQSVNDSNSVEEIGDEVSFEKAKADILDETNDFLPDKAELEVEKVDFEEVSSYTSHHENKNRVDFDEDGNNEEDLSSNESNIIGLGPDLTVEIEDEVESNLRELANEKEGSLTVDDAKDSIFAIPETEKQLISECSVLKPSEAYPDEEIVEESGQIEENGVLRPFVADLDEEIVEGSGQIEENGVLRPFVADPDEEIVEESGEIDENGVLRPFFANPDEEIIKESGELEEKGVLSHFEADPDEEIVEKSGQQIDEHGVLWPFVADPDQEIVEESDRQIDEKGVLRPFVANPDEEIVEESSQIEENGVLRPFVANPDEEIVEESDQIDENGVLRPFISNPDEEIVENPTQISLLGDENSESEEIPSEKVQNHLEMIQGFKVKLLRVIHKLGLSPQNQIAENIVHKLFLASKSHSIQDFSVEDKGQSDFDFSLNILVIGKTGVGKSATINSIFGEEKAKINAFEPATTCVKEIVGTICGVKFNILDTPGLRSSPMEQSLNNKILRSIKKFMKKSPPDVVLYVDRVDTNSIGLNDLPLLRSITCFLGPSIWKKSILMLTHAGSTLPDGRSGLPLSYEEFVDQRSQFIQQSISHEVGILPVFVVENREIGQNWRFQLLILCCSMKILSEGKEEGLKSEEEEKGGSKMELDSSISSISGVSLSLSYKMGVNGGLKKKKKVNGQICVRTRRLEHLQVVFIAILMPIAKTIFGKYLL